MNIQQLLGTFLHGLSFQKLPYYLLKMNSFYFKHMLVISCVSLVMRNNLTGPVKLGDVTQIVIKSLVSQTIGFSVFYASLLAHVPS